MKLQHLKKALATVLTITLLAGSGQSLTARATEVAEDNAILNEEENTENQEGEATATDPIAPTGQEGEAALLEPLSLTGQEGEPDTLAPMATSSGKAGENATWTVEDGVLTISGSGEVTNIINLSQEEKETITKLVVEEGITGFGPYISFADMTALTELVLPEGLMSIPTFSGCTSLTEVTLPDTVTEMPSFVFRNCTSLTEVTLPDTVTKIHMGAFVDCTNLKKITAKGATFIGDSAFFGCTSLTEVTLPDTITDIANRTFFGCTSLTEVTLPDTVTEIHRGAFADCTNLKKITANGVTSIWEDAFKECSSLEEYSFSANLEKIGNGAFDGCVKLADENGLIIINNFFCGLGKEVAGPDFIFPEGITSINANLPDNFTSVTIPASVKQEFLSSEFMQNYTLQKLEVAEENSMYASQEGCLYNKERTEFLFCPRGKSGSLVIPRGVEKIEYWAISACSYVTEVYVPDSVKDLSYGMFGTAASDSPHYAPLYFEGDAPFWDKDNGGELFRWTPEQKIYYVEGTNGWDALKAEYPDIQWLTWDGKGPWDDTAPENPGDGTNPGGGTENPGDGTNPGEGTENPPEETLPTEATVTGQSTTEELTQKVLSAIAGTGKGAVITVEMKEGTILTTEIMEKLQEKGDSLIVISNTPAGNVVWRFEAIEKTVAFNPVAAIGAQVTEMINKLKDTTVPYVPISFQHEGILPGKALVNLDLTSYSGKFAEGEVLYLYYYDPQTGLFEKTSTGSYLSGRAVFTMEHCSDYIVTNKELSKALTEKPAPGQNVTSPKTGDEEGGRMVFLWIPMVCAVAGFAAMTITRRKYRNTK